MSVFCGYSSPKNADRDRCKSMFFLALSTRWTQCSARAAAALAQALVDTLFARLKENRSDCRGLAAAH
jgi:hypothetical protein